MRILVKPSYLLHCLLLLSPSAHQTSTTHCPLTFYTRWSNTCRPLLPFCIACLYRLPPPRYTSHWHSPLTTVSWAYNPLPHPVKVSLLWKGLHLLLASRSKWSQRVKSSIAPQRHPLLFYEPIVAKSPTSRVASEVGRCLGSMLLPEICQMCANAQGR